MEVGIVEQNPETTDPERRAPGGPPAQAEADRAAAERLDEIRQYLRDLYAAREVIASTTTLSGDRVDWVPVESQVDGKIADLPGDSGPTEPSEGERRAYPLPSELDAERAEVGPPGTVPVARKDIDSIRPTGDLQGWLAKGNRPKTVTPPDDPAGLRYPAAGDDVHKYAHAAQWVTCYGTEGVINTWQPYVQWSNEFSLGQLWLMRGNPVLNQTQTVEVGVQTYNFLYGDWLPHVFVFYTTNNYTKMDDYIGGYNTDVKGWVQSSRRVYPGMRAAASVFGGDQYDMALKVQLSEGNWWVRLGAEWMGYYPASLYSPTGLHSQAENVDWGGEMVDAASDPGVSATWMGSGRFPYEGWQQCAYMKNLTYQSNVSGTMVPFQGYPSVTNPNSYNIWTDFTGAGGAWGSYFWWGGPGGV